MSQDLISFDAIEGQKENIQALPSGRSAKKLAALFSPDRAGPLHKTPTPTETRHANDEVRIRFESEIAAIDESDDPLDVYDRYVRWTLDAYPSAQATPQSGLHTLLERATKSFVGSVQYQNDPRYLRLWIHYIHFFSDAPREAYVYLSRHGIGHGLALFYEEYAGWLEAAGRAAQAEEVYRLGIEREAQPAARLLRKSVEFEQRRRAQQQAQGADEGPPAPSSPALPAVRPALAAKIDPFSVPPFPPGPADPQSQPQPQPRRTGGGGGKAKMAIFSDADAAAEQAPPPAMGSRGTGTVGWDSIGSLADRKKENTMEPKPWAGETLKVGVKKSSGPKMAVFKDTSHRAHQNQQPLSNPVAAAAIVLVPSEHQVTVHPHTGKKERIFVDLVAVYPTPEVAGSELSFEEIWARNRGWLDVDWETERRVAVAEKRGAGAKEEEQEEVKEEEAGPNEGEADEGEPDGNEGGGGVTGAKEQKQERPQITATRKNAAALGEAAQPSRKSENFMPGQDTGRLRETAGSATQTTRKSEKLALRQDTARHDETTGPAAAQMARRSEVPAAGPDTISPDETADTGVQMSGQTEKLVVRQDTSRLDGNRVAEQRPRNLEKLVVRQDTIRLDETPSSGQTPAMKTDKLTVLLDTVPPGGTDTVPQNTRKTEKLVVRQDTIRLDEAPSPGQAAARKTEKLVVRQHSVQPDENNTASQRARKTETLVVRHDPIRVEQVPSPGQGAAPASEKLVVHQDTIRLDDTSPSPGQVPESKSGKLMVRQDTIRLDETLSPGQVAATKTEKKLVVRQDTIRLDDTPLPGPVPTRRTEKLVVRQDTIRLDDTPSFPGPAPATKTEQPVVQQENVTDDDQDRPRPPQPPTTQKIPLRDEGETVVLDENGAVMKKPRGGRRKKVMEMNETQIIKAKLDSPSRPKIKKRSKTAEATVTMHTKAATDEIYEIFGQPLKPGRSGPGREDEEDDGDEREDGEEDDENEDQESAEDEADYETDADLTSVPDSTRTTTQIDTSEVGDDERDGEPSDAQSVASDVQSVASAWSDFTAGRHIPFVAGAEEGNETGMSDENEVDDDNHDDDDDDIDDGIDDDDDDNRRQRTMTRTVFVPVPPEDYEPPPTRQYRDPVEVANNRLPFMTPITECTESSVALEAGGGGSHRRRREPYKTPSKPGPHGPGYLDHHDELEEDEEEEEGEGIAAVPSSSPIREVPRDSAPPSPIRSPSPPPSAPVAFLPGEPIIKDALCNPMDDSIRDEILARLDPPLASYPGFFDRRDERYEKGAEIRKFAKAIGAGAGGSGGGGGGGADKSAAPSPVVIRLPGAAAEYTIKRELGSGSFGPVYLIGNSDPGREGRAALEALKMETPPTPWELHMMRLAHARLGPGGRAAASISAAHELHLYRDEAFLILPYHRHGTLLDLVNSFRLEQQQQHSAGAGAMDEPLAMFFAVELLRTVEALHSRGIIHGDIKADNCMLRLDSGGAPLSGRYRPDGGDGWAARGICLIDLGRGIDMTSFAAGTQFIADWKTTSQDCVEMREGRPWTWQIDNHGLAGVLHCLLFGRYMETIRVESGAGAAGLGADRRRYKIREGLKRYWQTDIWAECFDLLLNPGAHAAAEEPGEGGRLSPLLGAMSRVRERMERWLEANGERGTGLRALMGRVEALAAARARR